MGAPGGLLRVPSAAPEASADDQSSRVAVAAVRLRTAGKRYKKVANATALIWRVLLVDRRERSSIELGWTEV